MSDTKDSLGLHHNDEDNVLEIPKIRMEMSKNSNITLKSYPQIAFKLEENPLKTIDASTDELSDDSQLSPLKQLSSEYQGIPKRLSAHLASPAKRPRLEEDEDDPSWPIIEDEDKKGTEKDAMSMSCSAETSSEFDFSDESDDESADKKVNISRAFDMDLLRSSIEKGSLALEKVDNKDIVLVLGKTGTGKSTLINFFAGKKLHTTFYTSILSGQTDVIKEVFEASDPLNNFEIGHMKKSKTKSINCFCRNSNQKILYIDSPGFEDTDGHEMDIATSVMLSQVAKKCKSLRFVILINYASLLEDRGGAMRAVLKVTRDFVQDFVKEKKSFMFLFTHTNEIKNIPDSLDDAKKCLLEEIVRTMEGTNKGDVEVMDVLEFMAKSLKKDFPFVNIFHPLKSDFKNMTSFIENKMSSVCNSKLKSGCGLTLTSKLKLEGEVKTLILNLRKLLEEQTIDTIKVMNIQKTFKYLKQNIDLSVIQAAVLESKDLIEGFVKDLQNWVESEIKLGIGTSNDFSIENAKSLKIALSQLKELMTESIYVDRKFEEIKQGLECFQKKLLIDRSSSFRGIPHILRKVHAWEHGYGGFLSLYEQSRIHLEQLMKMAIDDVENFNLVQFYNISEKASSDFICNLGVLQSTCDETVEMAFHEIDTRIAFQTLKDGTAKIENFVLAWDDESTSMMDVDNLDIEILTKMATQAKILGAMKILLRKKDGLDKIFKLVTSALISLGNKVVDMFSISCSSLKKPTLCFEGDLQTDLKRLKIASTLFNDVEGFCRKQLHTEYISVLDYIKNSLKGKCEEATRLSKEAAGDSMRNGHYHGETFASFSVCEWFDDFLPQEDHFVKNCSIAIKNRYDGKCNAILKSSRKYAKALVDNRIGQNCENLISIKSILPELKQISHFGSFFAKKNISSAYCKAQSKLKDYIASLGQMSISLLKDWLKAVKNEDVGDIRMHTEALNEILHEIELLLVIEDIKNLSKILQGFKTRMCQGFNKVSIQITNEMKVEGAYKQKASALACVEAMGEFNLVQKFLPNITILKNEACCLIDKDATRIESLVEETARFDEMDKLLGEFESAKELDRFTMGQASSRLRLLSKLREKKETDVDAAIQEMICKEDFHGMREFLTPLADSSDQMKKQKFNQLRRKIMPILHDKCRDIGACLCQQPSPESVQIIVRGLDVLTDAQNELGKYLRSEMNLASEIKCLKQELNKAQNTVLDKIMESAKSKDFEKLARNVNTSKMIETTSSTYLFHKTRKGFTTAMSKHDETVDSVPLLTNDFFNSAFKQKGPELLATLASLKRTFEHDLPCLQAMSALYLKTNEDIENRLNDVLLTMREGVAATQCFEDAIATLHALTHHFKAGLNSHIILSALVFNPFDRLEDWKRQQKKLYHEIDFESGDIEEKLTKCAKQLDQLKSGTGWSMKNVTNWLTGRSYDTLLEKIQTKAANRFSQGKGAVQIRDAILVQECIEMLSLMHEKVGKHIPGLMSKVNDLRKRAINSFLSLCEQAEEVLQSENINQFEALFVDYSQFVLVLPSLMKSEHVRKHFSLVNQLVFEKFDQLIKDLKKRLEINPSDSFDFLDMKSRVEYVRSFGSFVADRFTLFYAEIDRCEHAHVDDWLKRMWKLCFQHFQAGRDLQRIKLYAILGVVPSSTSREIKRGFREKAKSCHPDKLKGKHRKGDISAMFRVVKEAEEELLAYPMKPTEIQPFDDLLRNIPSILRTKVREFLTEQRYDIVERLLFALPGLSNLNRLVTPNLNSQLCHKEIVDLTRSHVQKTRINVDSNWAERRYKELNENINDLKMMENYFKAYRNIFPSSWNDGIVQNIREEIESLGQNARKCVENKTIATREQDRFRHLFVQMGFVLVEMPLFKSFTKEVMANILESCLDSNWGYSYLFELGLSLQRGNENCSDDENRIAQVLVSDFSHFKEVLTMVWNQETCQKPVEDTVRDVVVQTRASKKAPCIEHIDIDREELLTSFKKFESEYKTFLGEYIKPDAELNILVQYVRSIAGKIGPLNCSIGWGTDTKDQITTILAGVFALFTVLKSGASYNRLESSEEANELGEKLLMKPHNIQVLTLLCMFGCGFPSRSSLESQLMQIRTGEGKSMILGAAATVLGILNFRVRCVCYSEYLSTRDFKLFEDVFRHFNLLKLIKYSKITSLSEDTTAAKGDIRSLTGSLIRGQAQPSKHMETAVQMLHIEDASSGGNSATLRRSSRQRNQKGSFTDYATTENLPIRSKNKVQSPSETGPAKSCIHDSVEEILLVDEVDVFFGSEFYGRTYNQVAQVREAEVAEIIKSIWGAFKKGGRRQRLSDIKALEAYSNLLQKLPGHSFFLDNEITLMLDQVRRVEDEPYYLDVTGSRIGYKVMDTICFDATYGYRTIFAYLKEADNGNLNNETETLSNVLAMPVSCGQFSYANISPSRILGVSGTLEAMGQFEKDVLTNYGINNFIYIPSVYGKSNFDFDKAGEGIYIEPNKSDFFQKISSDRRSPT